MIIPEDIALGDNPSAVERKPARGGVVVWVRLSADEADQLQTIAEKRQTTISRIAREAITGYFIHGLAVAPPRGAWTGTVSDADRFELLHADHGSAPQTVDSVE